MGCLTVILRKVGEFLARLERRGGISVRMKRHGGDGRAEMKRRGGISVSMGLVCNTNLGDIAVLWVSDGPLLTIDEGYLITK